MLCHAMQRACIALAPRPAPIARVNFCGRLVNSSRAQPPPPIASNISPGRCPFFCSIFVCALLSFDLVYRVPHRMCECASHQTAELRLLHRRTHTYGVLPTQHGVVHVQRPTAESKPCRAPKNTWQLAQGPAALSACRNRPLAFFFFGPLPFRAPGFLGLSLLGFLGGLSFLVWPGCCSVCLLLVTECRSTIPLCCWFADRRPYACLKPFSWVSQAVGMVWQFTVLHILFLYSAQCGFTIFFCHRPPKFVPLCCAAGSKIRRHGKTAPSTTYFHQRGSWPLNKTHKLSRFYF